MMKTSAEFSPQYHWREKVRHLLIAVALLAIGFYFKSYYLLPYIERLPCELGEHPERLVQLWWTMLVWLPLAIALILFLLMGGVGWRSLKEGQFPPKG